ncbi:hypothetical protein BKA70DRAFT_1283716 [Coprinopsis sp. MPI-PUGE-AT-0042]|nr:hypothetical protein BKA70DRAFT_1283716 [Coprinopsis sp. MPI-PUGE-AT-0042]
MEVQPPAFPTEIFVLIIDILGADLAPYTSVNEHYRELHRTLSALAITCRTFRHQATRHLFHTLALWGEPDRCYSHYVRKFRSLASALADPAGPAAYVRTVAITFSSGADVPVDEQQVRKDKARTVEDILTTPWITFYQEVLPGILHPLRNVRTLLLNSDMVEPDMSFALLTRTARAAILQCIRSNPLKSFMANRIALPWEILLALPASLQILELGNSDSPFQLELGESARFQLEGSDDYTADASMFQTKSEAPLTISPRVLRLSLLIFIPAVLVRQSAAFFCQLKVLDYKISWIYDMAYHHAIVSRTSPTVEELVIRINDVKTQDHQLLLNTMPAALRRMKPLPSLRKLSLVFHQVWDSIHCPPFFANITEQYLAHLTFHPIKVLEIAGTWLLQNASYSTSLEDRLIDPSAPDWDALDIRLAGLPNLELVNVTLGAEGPLFSPSSTNIRDFQCQLRAPTDVDVARLLPRTRTRGIEVILACNSVGLLPSDLEI